MQMKEQKRSKSLANLLYTQPVTSKVPAVVFIQFNPRILALDPGTKNCAYSVIELDMRTHFNQKLGTIKATKYEFKIVAQGMIRNPISDMKHLSKQAKAFRSELISLLDEHKVDALAAERFQSRGFRNVTGECVSAMLGIMATLPGPRFVLPYRSDEWIDATARPPIKMLTVTASTWKNKFNRESSIPLNELYKSLKSQFKLSTHLVDSMLIAIFALIHGIFTKYGIRLTFRKIPTMVRNFKSVST